MELDTFLRLLPSGTCVRIKVAGFRDKIAVRIGTRRMSSIINDIYSRTKEDLYVYAIYPLYHAQELYIECW